MNEYETTDAAIGTHRFRNNATAIAIGDEFWERSARAGLLELAVRNAGGGFVETRDGHRFLNLCSCSYLGLDVNPRLLEGAITGLREAGEIVYPTSRCRVYLSPIDEVESQLSELFGASALTAISSAAATAGVLPLLASGHLSEDGVAPVMIFDKFAHFSMNFVKPICGDETRILTSPHNDLDFIEDACKTYRRVAYVADGAYSMGGHAPLEGLMSLQDRYGLMLFFDDSHSLSARGARGEGYVRNRLGEDLNPLTVIVASLGKAFGACGGVILMSSRRHHSLFARYGGPLSWSQSINYAGFGAIRASIEIHRSPELVSLQCKLLESLALFDRNVPTAQRGMELPIRVIRQPTPEAAVKRSRELLAAGFYVSAVFFPILPRGEAGLRVMPRADIDPRELQRFCDIVGSWPEVKAAP